MVKVVILSVFEDILIDLRDCIQNSDEFKDIDVYFDDSEMNPNVSLPAISFKIGKSEVVEYCLGEIEVVRHMEIRLHTETLDKRLLQSELYDYEEQMSKLINSAKLEGSIAIGYDIKQIATRGIGALLWNARKQANQFDATFFSNILRMSFDVRYRI